MSATVPMGMLAEIQGWAPGGGFVRSQWRTGIAIARGDLMRRNGAWAVVTACGEAVSTDSAGEVVDKSPAIAWRAADGTSGTEVLWGTDGAEVRTDTRIDLATIPAS